MRALSMEARQLREIAVLAREEGEEEVSARLLDGFGLPLLLLLLLLMLLLMLCADHFSSYPPNTNYITQPRR